MRLPLVVNYGPRDMTRTKDEKSVNAYAEKGATGQVFSVKRPGLTPSNFVGVHAGQGCFIFNGIVYSIVNDTLTEGGDTSPHITLGRDGTLPSARYSNMVYFNSAYWYWGASGATIYTSADGITFTAAGATPYTGSSPASLIVLGSKLYALPPSDGTAVYSSTDGMTWTLVTADWGVGLINKFAFCTFNSKIYVIGGTTSNGVWHSADGLTWTQDVLAVNFPVKSGAAASFNGSIYFFQDSMLTGIPFKTSSDGITWTDLPTTMDTNLVQYSCQAPLSNCLQVLNSQLIFIDRDPLFHVHYGYSTSDGVVWNKYSYAGSYTPETPGSLTNTGTVLRFFGSLTSDSVTLYSTTGTQYPLTTTASDLPFDFSQSSVASGNTGFFFKSTKDAYYFDTTLHTATKITDPNYPATTVPGIAYLDGTYYVMTPAGAIHGSNLEDPTVWSALNVIQAGAEPDNGVAIARYLNYIVAYGVYTTEFFYDAANPVGSPLLPVSNALALVGCTSGTSVAQVEGTLYFMGTTKQHGRSIYRLVNAVPEKISTVYVDRVISADDLATVWSYSVRVNGHTFYVLTLKTTDVTLVYDQEMNTWSEWRSSVPGSTTTLAAGAVTYVSGYAFVNQPGHGFSDGDPILMQGTVSDSYNGTFSIRVIDADNYSYPIRGAAPVTPATGTKVVNGFSSTRFSGVFYAGVGTSDIVQDETTGYLYTLQTTAYSDNGNPIDVQIITPQWDANLVEKKFFLHSTLVSDKGTTYAYLRWTNDDYQTWSSYQILDMSLNRTRTVRGGNAYRRAFELRHTDATAFRVEALDIDVEKGVA